MEDMATGEIRLGLLWEWLHKHAAFTEADDVGVQPGDTLTEALLRQLVADEYRKLQAASDRDVHNRSKTTTLPISLAALEKYVDSDVKLPWYIDLLNLNLDVADLGEARRRLDLLLQTFTRDQVRITRNLNR
jgi:malate synthase